MLAFCTLLLAAGLAAAQRILNLDVGREGALYVYSPVHAMSWLENVLLAAGLLGLSPTSANILGLYSGARCSTLDGGSGTCQLLSACRDPGDFRVEQPPICSFRGKEPVICCPGALSDRQSPGFRAAQYCRNMAQICSGIELSPVKDNFGSSPTRTEQPGQATELPPFEVHGGLPAKPRVHVLMTLLLLRRKRDLPFILAPEPDLPEDKVLFRHFVFNGEMSMPKEQTHMKGEDLSTVIPKDQPVLFVVLPKRKRQAEGTSRVQVYHGVNSQPKSRTYMVLIGYGPENNKAWGCGGSLVTAKFVLSAAHCSAPELLGEAKWARLGDLDISTTKDDAKTQDREIAERMVHPEYREPQVYHDIALFRLDREVEFTPWVAPVCLHTQRNMPAALATVTGWGRVDFAGETSNHLLEADLDVYNDTECRRLLPFKDNKTPRGVDSDLMFCAGKSDGSKDACSGDSGGPLVVKLAGQCLRTQIGVTSYGNMCGLPDSPGVYTRISHYIAWIEGIAFQ